MPEISKKYQDQLKRIKRNVDTFREYFQENYTRFDEFRRFVFASSLDNKDIEFLRTVKKPEIEFNYAEAYLSRLIGEFAKQEPSITVSAADGTIIDANMIELIKFVEGHMRYILFKANNDGFEAEVYKEILSGGFSGMRVWTDYCNEMSFNQDIYIGKCFSPTLMGFDPLAKAPHKGDGEYCFEIYPKRLEEFKRDYPDIDLNNLSFTTGEYGYKWSYSNGKEKILLICDYYEKKKKKVKIVKLANNQSLTEKEYKKYLAEWVESGEIAQPAAKVSERWTELQTICRYRIIENQVIEYIETDYDELPIVFADGNSIILDDNGSYKQMTRPYIYHAKGIQKLINFSGQSLAFELQNMVQHKWKVAIESLNTPFSQALKDNQIPNVIIYNAFKNNDVNQPVPPPQEIIRQPCPPEIMNTFMAGAQVFQNIMGSYDASLGINNNQLSGVAIVEGATQSNAVAMPHIMGYLQALNQVAQIIIKLIPKYLITPRTIPVMHADGKHEYILINQPGGININYCPNDLRVKVEAGVNFNIQKNRTLQQLTQLAQAMPIFGQFMNQKGLKVLVNNLEVRGQDELANLAEQFMAEIKQQQQMQQKMMAQQANQPNPLVMRNQIEQQKNQIQAQQQQMDSKLDGIRVMNDLEKTKNERMNIMLKAASSHADQAVQAKKADAEVFAHAADLALKTTDQQHQHAHDTVRLAHELTQAQEAKQNSQGEE